MPVGAITNARFLGDDDNLYSLIIANGQIASTQPAQAASEFQDSLDANGRLVCPIPYDPAMKEPILDLSRDRAVAARSAHAIRFGLETEPAGIEADRIETFLKSTGETSLWITHLTTQAGLDAVRSARSNGRDIHIAVPITHLFFNDIDMAGFDPLYRLSPPLQSEDNRQALLEGIGLSEIDAIISASLRLPIHAKHCPFQDAAPGSYNTPYLIPALCTLALNEDIPLSDLLKPALCSGLMPQKGTTADLIILDPEAPVPPSHFKTVPFPSAFAGRRMTGKVLHILVNGEIVPQPQL